MWKQRNKKPTMVLEMDDKIQMFCLAAAKLSSVLSGQRLGKERFSSEPSVPFGAAQDTRAERRQGDSLTLKMRGNKKGSAQALVSPKKHGSVEGKKKGES